ncbi:GRIP and coiled-coil domain-containing protein 1-like [Anopheles merus]|uniref:GRIP domain-containing protein n=1 Tax=Anopheles merus TaxID=30066 RepID=A0A182V1V1_ANOME|nr:GRIP and coiled-coil domain-containing protein 1-like [Anopheles merus]XP_041786831.1 GRIP and coiled-coil domain-containing protein 1-like [Anopheles merus]XP_041786834.1 GRIP and coiled-coil domain-containing protein 1-like [Anopheles merus]XP_041786835.1 GRIP and coiled-coil domain-containing protein 1-like [Anopheles merus]
MEKRKHESNKLKEYESIISSQKEHINRYENRLKDIIVAYKGIAKEKVALEETLKALQKVNDGKEAILDNGLHESSEAVLASGSVEGQLQTLMNNLTIITAERNRIEEVSKYERNQLRQKLENKDSIIEELSRRIKDFESQSQFEMSSFNPNTLVDYGPRIGPSEDQSVKIRELKKLLDDERNLNEQLELQLGNLKTQFMVIAPDRQTVSKKLVDAKKTKSTDCDSKGYNNSSINLKESLRELQDEMNHLKKQYAIAVAEEKQRVRLAEENSKRLREIHEERVANFESRIKELSEMVGRYDRIKEQDKVYILQLKTAIANLKTKRVEENNDSPQYDRESIEDGYGAGHLLLENHSIGGITERKEDFSFLSEIASQDQHADEKNELKMYKRRYEQALDENQRLKKDLLLCQENVSQLKQKIDVQKQSTAQLEFDLQQKITDQQIALKNDSVKHTEALIALQASFERKITHLQDSLQNQRERSLAVMDEKEEEIRTLRTSLEILSISSASATKEFHNDTIGNLLVDRSDSNAEPSLMMVTSLQSLSEDHQHLIHYAQEIARMNLEISALRTSKNSSEASLRKLAQEKVMIEETYKTQILAMEKEMERLRRNRQLEGSNLEYLKNVVLSFLLSKDTECKKHMTNAIAAVLKFDEYEVKAVNNINY